jgi:type IV pilus assembly protein PilB
MGGLTHGRVDGGETDRVAPGDVSQATDIGERDGMTEDAEQSARRLAEQHGLRFVDLTKSALAAGASSLLPEAVARQHRAVPIGRRLGTPVIAVTDPGDLFAMDALRSAVGREFVAVVARDDQVDRALGKLYADGGGDTLVDTAPEPVPTPTVPLDPSPAPPSTNGSVGQEADFAPATPVAAETNGVDRPADDGPPAPVAKPSTLEESLREILSPPEPAPYTAPLPPAPLFEPADPPGSPTTDGQTVPADEVAPEAADLSVPEPPSAVEPAGEPPEIPDPATAVTVPDPVATGVSADAPPPPPPGFNPTVAGGSTPPPAPEGYGVVGEAPPPSEFYGPPLARVLVEAGRVSPEDMATALQAHQRTGESLARYLYNQNLATEEDLVWAMAQEVGLEFVDLSHFPIEQAAAGLIPEATARHHMVLPIRIENGVPIVAMANPTDVFAMDDLRTIMGRNFTPVVATRSQIASHLRYAREADVDVSEIAEDAAGNVTAGAGFELESLQAVVEDAPIVRYVNLLILQALNERASDIHIEPTPKRLRIRFRIDGVMHDATSASSSIGNAVVSRLKVLGEMDITEHRIPQEGRVSLSVSDRQIDLRITTLPSIYGESVVMRLLDKSIGLRSLPDLGFPGDTLDRYAQAYRHPYGVILVTGPTGAGKTTTLYATLAEILSPEKAVVTVEDPVEYRIDGVTQVQINPKAGLLFSTALKSILRADPDIVLIGEIRDTDTAMIAMEAALSGHLVLSTLHTNSAAATPLRLTEMGIEPFLVTSACGSVLTQRLARVLCPQCKEPYEATESDFAGAGYIESDLEGLDLTKLYRAVGCRACSHTGYFGRTVLAEVMNMTEEVDRMIIEQSSIVNIERQAIEQGMRTLRQDGLLKAVSGETTLEEVMRVVVV